MKNDEILTKAIEKAKQNGFDCFGWKHFQVVVGGVGFWDYDDVGSYAEASERSEGYLLSNEELIFNHDFAKALWGEEKKNCADNCKQFDCFDSRAPQHDHYGWRYYLQQQVLEEDRIQYMEAFI